MSKYRFTCMKCQAVYTYHYYPDFPWSCFNCHNDDTVLVEKLSEDDATVEQFKLHLTSQDER